MNVFREAIAWLVAASGFFFIFLFLPQIKLLLKVKKSESNSLWTLWGSFGAQVVTLIHIFLQPIVDHKLAFVYATSLTGCLVIAGLVHYYRRYPGGRI